MFRVGDIYRVDVAAGQDDALMIVIAAVLGPIHHGEEEARDRWRRGSQLAAAAR
jgi:hypothetical protein